MLKSIWSRKLQIQVERPVKELSEFERVANHACSVSTDVYQNHICIHFNDNTIYNICQRYQNGFKVAFEPETERCVFVSFPSDFHSVKFELDPKVCDDCAHIINFYKKKKPKYRRVWRDDLNPIQLETFGTEERVG